MPLLASASFDGGIGNSATATSIESFEAVVANQHIRRRDAMDLKANDFFQKDYFSLVSVQFKNRGFLDEGCYPNTNPKRDIREYFY